MKDPSSFQVITENVRREANKWRDLSADMAAVARNPVNNGLELGVTSFFIGPTELVPTAMHHAAYVDYLEHVKKLVAGAAAEWEQLHGALRRMADHFDATDQTAKADLEKIYTEPVTKGSGRLEAHP